MIKRLVIAGLLLGVASCGGSATRTATAPSPAPSAATTSSQANAGTGGFAETKTPIPASASTASLLPNSSLTPGATLDVTKSDICVPGYSSKVRDVPEAVKKQVYEEYGITSHRPREYEVDHLISLELGGSNSIKNLWPQSYETETWNAHVKDRLENELHRRVCNGELDLKEAQKEISTDWIAAYRKYLGEPGQAARNEPHSGGAKPSGGGGGSREASAPTNSSGPIIGNKKSRVYHRPDCPDYNKVSPGNRVEFGSAAEAERAGYKLARNCPK